MTASLISDGTHFRRATPRDLDNIVALQRAAYARNRTLLGVEPSPLMVDYADVLATKEVWCHDADGELAGVLILEPEADHLMIWSIGINPTHQSRGLGNRLLAAAEVRARELGVGVIRLYTGTVLSHLTGWYGRHGYVTDSIEQLSDRSRTNMSKRLDS
jgi:N-acetylglutamate synthase-like GNAT family acetyltransferase